MALVLTAADIVAAAARIDGLVHRTPLMTSRLTNESVGVEVVFKCEHLQRAGAFKMRGATNAVRSLTDDEAGRGVAAHSSGNHAAAVALAARDRGISAHLVMPTTTPQVKVDAVRGYGGEITMCEPTLAARDAGLAEVVARTGAVEIHPYDDPAVMAGAGTVALELLADADPLDAIVAPLSGGGLLSGTSVAAHNLDADIAVWGIEPAGADDAARSLAAGELVDPGAPKSVADGLLAPLSPATFDIVRVHVAGVGVVTDEQILDALEWCATRLKQVVEPSGATSLAGLRELVASGRIPRQIDGRPTRVGVILSGGNVDRAALR